MTYTIRQLKLYTLEYTVDASSECEALRMHANSESKPDLDSLSFIEEPIDIGMSTDELASDFAEWTDDDQKLLLDGDENFLPGIYSIIRE